MQEDYERRQRVLEVKDLSLDLGGKLILEGVNAEVKKLYRSGEPYGQVVGIIGPSGVGKTRLIRCIAGSMAAFQQPTSGSVHFYEVIGEYSRPIPYDKVAVGYVPQDYALEPTLHDLEGNIQTLEGLIRLGKRQGTSREDAEKKAFELLEQVGLKEHTYARAHQLSGGQKQRLAIAQRLVYTDRFLVMDEPFSNLDILMIEDIRNLMRNLVKSHPFMTILISTHDVQTISQLADTLWLLGRNRDETSGNPIGGAFIKYEYDMAKEGLAWKENIEDTSEFRSILKEIKARFREL
ncbi:MAG: ATP-binding cassette domain-containing protein [Nanoarchaeota archaeon]